jgi:hypothetical protein
VRALGLLTSIALVVCAAGCAGLGADTGTSEASATSKPTNSASFEKALVADQRLTIAAAYGEGPAIFGPPPVDARPAVQADQLPELYAKASPTPAELVDYDFALAELQQVVWPGTKVGQLVWLVVNHHQHELPAGSPLNTWSPEEGLPDQDTVTVFDATDGAFLVQQQGQRLVPAPA